MKRPKTCWAKDRFVFDPVTNAEREDPSATEGFIDRPCTSKPVKKGLCQKHLQQYREWKEYRRRTVTVVNPKSYAYATKGRATVQSIVGFDEAAPFDPAQFHAVVKDRVQGVEPQGQEGSGLEPQALHVDEVQSDRGDRGLGPGLLPGEHGEVYRSSQAEERPGRFAQGPMVLGQEDLADGASAEDGRETRTEMTDGQ